MSRFTIHRRDQQTLAVMTALALASVVAWWFVKGGGRGGLVDIEHAAPLRFAFVVDVNEADWPELVQLPGVGEILAKRIVENRQANGPYLSAKDLMRVDGIGPKKLAAMQHYLLMLPEDAAVAER